MKSGLGLHALAWLLIAASGCSNSARPDDVSVETVMIPMRDGVSLASDIYRLAGTTGERLPILLHRTPYDKTAGSLAGQARYFARQGYLAVVQDLRGRYQSEGSFTKYIGEGQDGYDTIEFLAAQPYSNGKIGMWGTSYAAHVQANAAKLSPTHLTTLVLNMGGLSNGWDHKIRNHGAFEIQQLTWAFRQLADESDDPVIKKLLEAESAREWLWALPFRRGLNPLSIAPNFESYLLEMLTHSDYDDYFKQLDINWVEYYAQTADIPMWHISGWYDSYCGGTLHNFQELSRLKNSPMHLMIGPWIHGGNARSVAGNVEFGPAAALPNFSTELHLEWFDHFLKGISNGIEGEAPIRLFVMGTGDGHRTPEGRLFHGGYWKQSQQWPLSGTRYQPLYFDAEGGLSTSPPTTPQEPTRYVFDPADPVPTKGGSFSSTSPIFESGAYDQRVSDEDIGGRYPFLPLKTRPDVVVFQTPPLEQPVEIVGPIEVRLWISSSAVDTDFTVKLVDVYPPSIDFPSGFEMNLTDGILRARYRNSSEKQELMEPGQIYAITLQPFPTANRFKAGHRIRVDISSSNFPRFDINPNTGEALGRHRRTLKAVNAIYHDPEHPSQVVLPVVQGELP